MNHRNHIAFMLAFVTTLATASNAIADDLTARIAVALEEQEIFTGESVDDISGVVVVYKGGDVIFERAYGYAEISHSVPNKIDTRFRVGSVSKPFTGAALLKLEEMGKLSLSDPLSKYFPSFPRGDEISLLQVLTHTAGLPDVFDFEDYLVFAMNHTSMEEKVEYFGQMDLFFDPGTDWKYSNLGYQLLALVIEIASETSYSDFLTATIFEPLEMHGSGSDDGVQIVAELARGYVTTRDGQTAYPDHFLLSNATGSGSVYTTPGDIFRFFDALNSSEFLSEEAKQRMFTPVPKSVDRRRLSGDSYGLGWRLGSDNGHKRRGHTGGINGYLANIDWYYEDDVLLIIMVNKQNRSFGVARTTLREVLTSD